MKNIQKMLVLTAAILSIFSAVAYAEMIQGVVASVNSASNELTVQTEDASKTVVYSAETQWPVDVTAPVELVGKKVSLAIDELNGSVVAVSLEETEAAVVS